MSERVSVVVWHNLSITRTKETRIEFGKSSSLTFYWAETINSNIGSSFNVFPSCFMISFHVLAFLALVDGMYIGQQSTMLVEFYHFILFKIKNTNNNFTQRSQF